jgi:RNA polymerase sigma-70 factor, ECF subfamily
LDFEKVKADELALHCLRCGDQASWNEFFRRFQPLITRVVLRMTRQRGIHSPQVVDDLVQDTFLKLCSERAQLMQSFKPVREDAIFSYIKVFTANLVHDHFKTAYSQKRGGGATPDPLDDHHSAQSSTYAPSSAAILERSILIQEINAFVRAVCVGPNADRDTKIFWLYYRVGLTASAIAALPTVGLTVKGVETIIFRLTRLVRQRACNSNLGANTGKTEGIQPEDSL